MSVPELRIVQLSPPLIVFNITPSKPAVNPVREFKNIIELSLTFTPLLKLFQLKPEFVDLIMIPFSPHANIMESEIKEIEYRSQEIPALTVFQLLPPLVLFKIIPLVPAIHPVCELMNLTERKESTDTPDC